MIQPVLKEINQHLGAVVGFSDFINIMSIPYPSTSIAEVSTGEGCKALPHFRGSRAKLR
jgi:hypothetical protein